MSYRNSSNAREKSKEKIDPNTIMAKTKLSQTASSTNSSKYPPVKRDSIKNTVPQPLPAKTKLKEEDFMTQSKIIQAKNGLQLLKKKMSQKGLLPAKSQNQQREIPEYQEAEYVGSRNPPKSKMLASEKEIRPKLEKQSTKKRTSQVVRTQQPQYRNQIEQAPIMPKNRDFEKLLQEELRKQKGHQGVDTRVSSIKQQKNEMPSEYGNEKLYKCSMGCQRAFRKEALQKHQNVCQKVFLEKRKAFDSAAQRQLQDEVKVVPKPKPLASKINNQTTKLPAKQKSKQSMPAWKLKSLQLRNGLKRAAGRPLNKQEVKFQEIQKDLLTQCSFCGRRFNAQAAERHIPLCQQQSKRMVNKTTQNIKKKW